MNAELMKRSSGFAAAEVERSSLCSVFAGERLYGIETSRIREVLGLKSLAPVPLAPRFIAGIVSYRGDVLTVVSFRALLGLPPAPGCILVLHGSGNDPQPFGLLADRVGAVMTLSRATFTGNPATLDGLGKQLFTGVFRMEKGLLVLIDPDRMQPSRLVESGLFPAMQTPRQQASYNMHRVIKENVCVS